MRKPDNTSENHALSPQLRGRISRVRNIEYAPASRASSLEALWSASRYLEDAIAAEKSFEIQLEGFAKESDDATVKSLFAQHALETKKQYEQLTARLEALGGSPSTLKSLLAHVFNFAPKVAQVGHDATDRLTQDLMMAYAVENAEVAMYESLAEVARIAGDKRTEELALAIQQQERTRLLKLGTDRSRCTKSSSDALTGRAIQRGGLVLWSENCRDCGSTGVPISCGVWVALLIGSFPSYD